MLARRTRASADEKTCALRYGILLVGTIALALAFGGSLASATPLGEAVDTAGSVVEPITEASAPPPPPSEPLPAPPSAPVATPTVPPPPVDQVPVKVPTPATPTPQPPSHVAPSSSSGVAGVGGRSADLPSVGGTTPPAQEFPGKVGNAPPGAAQRAAPSVHSDAGAGSDSPSFGVHATTPGDGIAPSVDAMALPHWLAHVWPAIALGRTWKALAILLVRWEGATSPPKSEAAQLSFPSVGNVGSNDVAGLSERSMSPTGPSVESPTASVPADAGMSFVLTVITSLLTLMALVVLARLVVGDEFFSSLRWPH